LGLIKFLAVGCGLNEGSPKVNKVDDFSEIIDERQSEARFDKHKKSLKKLLHLSPGVNRELTLRCCNKQTWANRLGYADRLRCRVCDGLGDSLGFL